MTSDIKMPVPLDPAVLGDKGQGWAAAGPRPANQTNSKRGGCGGAN